MKNSFYPILASTLLFASLITYSATAQKIPEYYIIEKGTEMHVAKIGAQDILRIKKSGLPIDDNRLEIALESVNIVPGEVILVTDLLDNVYRAVDPAGRELYFKGKLTPVNRTVDAELAYLLEDYKGDTDTILRGSFIWTTGRDSKLKSFTVQYRDGKILNVPMSIIKLMSEEYKAEKRKAIFYLLRDN